MRLVVDRNYHRMHVHLAQSSISTKVQCYKKIQQKVICILSLPVNNDNKLTCSGFREDGPQPAEQFLHRIVKYVITTEVQSKLVAHVKLQPAVWLKTSLHRQRNYLFTTLGRINHLC